MANIAYLLVFVEGEDQGSQRSLIGKCVSAKNLRIDNYITVELPSQRKERGRRVRELFAGVNRWDVIVVSDLAARGDDVADVIAIVSDLLERGVRFIAAKQEMDLGSAGDNSSKTATALFAMLTSVEKEVASRRVRGALAQKRKEGVVLGRPKGSLSASKTGRQERAYHRVPVEGCE
jgi:DNA invertase Pin-like site-specific DNA recombinase